MTRTKTKRTKDMEIQDTSGRRSRSRDRLSDSDRAKDPAMQSSPADQAAGPSSPSGSQASKRARSHDDQGESSSASKRACSPDSQAQSSQGEPDKRMHESDDIDQSDQKEQAKTVDIQVPALDNINDIKRADQTGDPLKKSQDKPESATGDNEVADEILNDIRDTFVLLTDEQRTLIMHIYYVYKNEVDEDSRRIILLGPAGTGKSTIIKFLGKLITWEENKTSDSPQSLKVLKCAFTNDSAANIEGLTIHREYAIQVPENTPIKSDLLAFTKEHLKDGVFFICDDISIIDDDLLRKVDERLRHYYNNEELYGNRFVLLVGDLHQLYPVNNNTPIDRSSELWTCCKFYELTKILRQQDDKFINALNNLRHCKMRADDIEFFNSRNVKNIAKSDQNFNNVPYMFCRNKFVKNHNKEKISQSIEIIENDSVKNHNKEKISQSKEKIENVKAFYRNQELEYTQTDLCVRVNLRYKLSYHVDGGDGLVVSATGFVRGFGYDVDNHVNIIWIEFYSKSIGNKAMSEYNKTHGNHDFENYVPIKKITDPNAFEYNIKNRFPLEPAEGITVHRSQGQTFHKGVCVNSPDDAWKLRDDRNFQYVALSRVKRPEDLYIKGELIFNEVEDEEYTNAEKELNRLRNESKLKIAFETFEDKAGDVIVYLNTESTFNDHYQFIASDKWYSNASLLIFTETNTIKSDEIEINDFEMVLGSGGGLICYEKVKKSLSVVSSSFENNITLYLYKKFLYIITGVFTPFGENETNLEDVLTKFTNEQNRRCLLMIGNLNKKLIDHITFLKFKPTCDITTVGNVNTNEVVFTLNLDIEKDNVGFYQYIPSQHKPIYVILPMNEFVQNVDQK